MLVFTIIVFVIGIIVCALFFIFKAKIQPQEYHEGIHIANLPKIDRYVQQKDNKQSTKINENQGIQTKSFSDDKRLADEISKGNFDWDKTPDIKGVCYELERLDPLPEGRIELVKYKSERFAELFGRGTFCSYFPGYGKLFNKTFDVWFEAVKSDEKQNLIEYRDIYTLMRGSPHFEDKIETGLRFYHELSRNKKGYLSLYKSNTKNKITWYAGIKKLEFTGIITQSEEGWHPQE
jgi:hypothetical protein